MIGRAGKREIWQTGGLMVRLECATPTRPSMRRFLTCNAQRDESLHIPQRYICRGLFRMYIPY